MPTRSTSHRGKIGKVSHYTPFFAWLDVGKDKPIKVKKENLRIIDIGTTIHDAIKQVEKRKKPKLPRSSDESRCFVAPDWQPTPDQRCP